MVLKLLLFFVKSDWSSSEENNFLHNLSLTDRKVPHFLKTFANNSSANIKLSKCQLSMIVQLGNLFQVFVKCLNQ